MNTNSFGNFSLPKTIMEKKAFTESELKRLLRAANSNIKDVSYIYKPDGVEIVCVTMENDYGYSIEVTADSLIALAYDVIEFMRYK